MRITIGIIVLAVTCIVAVRFSRSQDQIDPISVDHGRVVNAETTDFVEPVVNKTIHVPVGHGPNSLFPTMQAVTVRSDGLRVRRPTVPRRVSQEILQLENDSKRIAKELRELREDESAMRQDLEERLRVKLDEEFEARMRIERDKVNELHERLTNVEGRLGKREDNRQLILDRRFAELTGDATLAWDTYSDNRVPGAAWSQWQNGTSFTPRPMGAPSSTRRFGSTRYYPEASTAKERRSSSRTLGRVFSSTLNRRTDTKKKLAAVAEAEKKARNVNDLQQTAGDLRQKIQEQVQSLRDSTNSGSSATDELNAAIDLLNELKDKLDSLSSRDESIPPEDSQ